MNKWYNIELAIKQLWLNESIRYYTTTEAGQWREATQGCVPTGTHAFKTTCGREWDVRNGWRKVAEKGVIMPEDPKHPMNSEGAHYRIPIAVLATLPEQMQKDFHAIREKVDQICNEAKEARMFAEYVQAAIKAQCVTTSDAKFNYILRDAYGKFKRS